MLELIESDTTILEDDIFIIGYPQKRITKKELLELKEMHFEHFLLSVWYYIIVNRNKIGSSEATDTFNLWYTQEGDEKHTKYIFSSSIGSKKREITIVTSKDKNHNSNFTISDISNCISCMRKGKSYIIDLSNYKNCMLKKYSNIHTLILDRPVPFYDIFECNYISKNYYTKDEKIFFSNDGLIENANINSVFEQSKYIILSGAGGIGKSMMLRHLFFDALNNIKEYNVFPILLNLRDFNSNYSSIETFAKESVKDYFSEEELSILFSSSSRENNVYLLDGYDEVSAYNQKHLNKIFSNDFLYLFKSRCIIASRPINDYTLNKTFSTYHLVPLKKEQAINLINKLDFRSDQPQIKERFLNKLQTTLYSSHKDFAENPLLLTIMLLTFESYAEVPDKMHNFYSAAFHTLLRHHDANKGSFLRSLKTDLTVDQFEELMEQFCTLSYRDDKYSLTHDEISRYLYKINQKQNTNIETTDLIYDLTTNTSLMYYDDGHYNFIHRSFQEYFCALFFSKRKDKVFNQIKIFFESSKNKSNDKTFGMLFDMIPNRVEEYIFMPLLKDLFEECDKADNPYYKYIEVAYSNFYLRYGSDTYNVIKNYNSFLFKFILNHYNLDMEIEPNVCKIYNDILYKNLLSLKKITVEEADLSKRDSSKFLPLKTNDILNESQYKEILDYFSQETFSLFSEFKNIRNFYELLKQKYNDSLSEDWFDII